MATLRSLHLHPEPEPIELSDEEWEQVQPILLARTLRGGRPPKTLRLYLEGIRWVAWTRLPWADMPQRYGRPDCVRRYYTRLRKSGTLERLLKAFPKSTSRDDAAGLTRVSAGKMLACLRDLELRRPRGRAAHAQGRSRKLCHQ